MRTILNFLFLPIGLLLCGIIYAQERPVSGRITGENNVPLAGVTVTVKGTNRSVTADNTGAYTISARPGDVLVFSYVGYQTSELTLQNQSALDVNLSRTDTSLTEVVVTAMDIKRNPRELGYSVQKVSGNEVAETQRENFLTSLQGRVAGATINLTSGAAGAGAQIVLRGFNSLSLSNSPLFVVDGIIVDNSTMNETSGGGSGLGLASDRANRGNDYTNRIADINPNDIESITVLKGPEATALYGSQASSGAIVITTKRGTSNGRLNLSYDNSFRLQKLTRFPENINVFQGGSNGTPLAQFTAFGPAYPSNVKLYDNLNSFFRTGFAQTHNLAADFGQKNYSFRVSGAYLNQQSPIPANTFKRYNARISNSTKFGKMLEITPAISFARTENDKPLRGASGYLLSLLVWPANDDITDWRDENGMKKPLFSANPNADFDNPFYNVYKNRSADWNNRIIGSMGVNFNPFNWLGVAGRFGYDTYRMEGYTRFDSMSFYTTRAQKGYQDNYYRNYYGYNHTITATARHTLGDFSGRLMVGNMWQDYRMEMYAVSGSNLKDMNSKDSSNTDPTTRIRLSRSRLGEGEFNYELNRQFAYFGEAGLGWKNAIFLTYSHRFEESSIFPKQFRKYDYPAASASFIVTDLIPGIKSNTLGFMKLRGSLASTARSSAPYANQSTFNINTGSGGGFYYGFTNSNPFLQPEEQQTFELGTELRLINNRFTVDATYYNTKNTNLIVEQFRASYGTGFVLNTLNIGSNRNQGVEISVDANVVTNAKVRWNTRLNFNRMWNEVLSLPANVPEFYQSDTWLYGNARGGLIVGGPTTTITGYGYQRNNRGQILIDPATGLPLIDATFKVRGDRSPDFTLGWLNNLTVGNFRFNMLWDLKVGGDIFNATEDYLTGVGRSKRTLDRMTPRVVEGVLRDGRENDPVPTRNTLVITPYYDQAYYTTMPEEEFIQKDVNWLRLRDVSVNYTLSERLLKNMRYFKTFTLFLSASELVLISNYNGADPQVNGVTSGSRGVGAFGFDYGNIGAPVSLNFGFRTNF